MVRECQRGPLPRPVPRPHQAARALAPAPCALGPGLHLLVAAMALAGQEELPSQTEAEGPAAFSGRRWRSGYHAAEGDKVRLGSAEECWG